MGVGRNDPCPCGSGRKYKRCCGASDRNESRFSSKANASRSGVERHLPTIVNGDGHLTVSTTSFYEVFDAESLFIEISRWRPKPDLETARGPDGRRLKTFEAHYQRKPRAERTVGDRVLVARLEWKRGGPLTVETNSTERDLEIREKLMVLPPSDLRFLRTEGRSVAATLAEPLTQGQRRRAEVEHEALMRNPEVRARLARTMRDYSKRWCDDVIPALGNRRPRTLVKSEAGKAKVLALLEEMESRPRPKEFGGMDFVLIRKELDLPPSV